MTLTTPTLLTRPRGEAEEIIRLRKVDLRRHRRLHRMVWEAGACYGPCGLAR